MEMEQGWFKQYTTAAYIDLGVGNDEPYKKYTRECAEWLGWQYDEIKGDSSLFRRFVGGEWSTGRIFDRGTRAPYRVHE